MNKIIPLLLLFLLIFACTQSAEKKVKEEVFSIPVLEQGDYLLVTGINEFDGQELKLRVDGFQPVEDIYSSGKVKLSLVSGSKVINSQYFSEMDRVEDVFPILESAYVSQVKINEYRAIYSVSIEFLHYK
ncbi:MAG: hypothetical protein JW703_05205 [Candidatus Diapherotrites archaeon]|nr:hypothetical protein [Candidatus Diapherotrites archaeon]